MTRPALCCCFSLAAALLLPPGARADFLVVPPDRAAAEGNSGASGLLSPFSATLQFAYDQALLAALPNNSQVTGLRFRLNANDGPLSQAATFADYAITLSRSNFAPDSLSLTFNDNVAADATLVRSGPLVLQPGDLPSGGSPSSFGALIAFDTPYTYTGGHLLLTIRHTGNTGGSANTDFHFATGLRSLDNFGNTATTALGDFNAGPVVGLEFTSPRTSAVPAPGGLALLAAGAGAVALVSRWRAFRQKSCPPACGLGDEVGRNVRGG